MLPTELINQSSSKVNHSISCRFRQVILPGTRINSPHFCESLNQLSGKYKYLLIADELKFNTPIALSDHLHFWPEKSCAELVQFRLCICLIFI